jgi:hypothetical protein
MGLEGQEDPADEPQITFHRIICEMTTATQGYTVAGIGVSLMVIAGLLYLWKLFSASLVSR